MRLGLPGLLILYAWHLPVLTEAVSYGCGYESLKTTKAMCYMRFHCGKANAKTNRQMLYLCTDFARKGDPRFLFHFPVCCLHPVIRRKSQYRSICRYLTKYSVDDGNGRCDPAAHKVVKVEVNKRPPRPRPRLPSWVFSWCPRQSASRVRKYPKCCFNPTISRRYKKQCAWMRYYKRRKREDTESDVMMRWVAEDDGVPEGYDEDMQEAIDAGETDIPEMKDAQIEVKCCGSGETKSCRGAECFYVCDDPGSDSTGREACSTTNFLL